MSTLSRLGAAIALVPLGIFLLIAAMQSMGWLEPSGSCGIVVIVALTLPLGMLLWLVGLFLAPPESKHHDSPKP